MKTIFYIMQDVQYIGDVIQEITSHLSSMDVSQLSLCSKILNKYLRMSKNYKSELDPQLGKMCLRPVQLQISNKILNREEQTILVKAPMSFGKTLLGLHIALTHPGYWLIVCTPNAIKTWWQEYHKCFAKTQNLDATNVLFLHSTFKRHYDYAKSCTLIDKKIIITTNIIAKSRMFLNKYACNNSILSPNYPMLRAAGINTNPLNVNQHFNVICDEQNFQYFAPKQIILSANEFPADYKFTVHSGYLAVVLPITKIHYFNTDSIKQIVDANFHTVIYMYNNDESDYVGILQDYKVFKHRKTLAAKRKFEACPQRAVLLIGLSYTESININADALIITNAYNIHFARVGQCIGRLQRLTTTTKNINVHIEYITRSNLLRVNIAVELYRILLADNEKNNIDARSLPSLSEVDLNLSAALIENMNELDALAIAYGHKYHVRKYWRKNSHRSENAEIVARYHHYYDEEIGI